MSNFYIEYETSSGTQYQEFTTGALLRQFIMDNKTTFINHCKVVAKLPEITDCYELFDSCSATSLDLSEFDTSNVMDMTYMFSECTSLTSLDLSTLDTSNVTSMYWMFWDCSNLTTLDISNLDTSNVTDMNGLFCDCSSLTEIIGIENMDVSSSTDIGNMFNGCHSLTSLDLSSWNTSNVERMYYTFSGMESLIEVNVSGWDVSKTDWTLTELFYGCISLTTIIGLDTWDTSLVTDISWMFEGCSSLTTIDISAWDTSNIKYTMRLFYNCPLLETVYMGEFNTTSLLSSGYDNMFPTATIDTVYFTQDATTVSAKTGYPWGLSAGQMVFEYKPTQIGKILFNTNEFKKIMFENNEYERILFNGNVVWQKESASQPIEFIDMKAVSTSATVDLTIDRPNYQTNDLLIAVVGSGGASLANYTLPSGWNILFETSGGSTYYGDARVYWKIATGSEPSNYTFTANAAHPNGQKGAIFSFRNVNTNNPFGPYATALNSDASNTQHIAPSITTVVDGSYIIRGFSYRNNNGTITTAPSGEQLWFSSSGSRPAFLIVGQEQSKAGATGTALAVFSNTYRDATFTLSLNPQ